MKNTYKPWMLPSLVALAFATGCAGGGYANNGLAGLGSTGMNPMGAVEGVLLNSVMQNMAGSVLNGQIGSQASQADQNFRLQQLGGLVQSGTVNQSQQWVNPQTGSMVAVNPVGQGTVNPQTRQKCQNMTETMTMPDGQTVSENRLACLDPQTGKWNLAQ